MLTSCSASALSVSVLLTTFVCALSAVLSTRQCGKADISPYILRGYQSSYLDICDREEWSNITGCKPVQLWSLQRHGTRYPHIGSLKRMDKYLTRMRKELLTSFYSGRGHLCSEDIARFEAWHFDKNLLRKAKFLTPSGYEELVEVGKRIKKRFPTIFGDEFNAKKYYFAYSNNQRNLLSCDAFGRGIFGDSFNATLDGNYDYLPEVGCRVNIAELTEAKPKAIPAVKTFFETAEIYKRVSKHYAEITGVEDDISNEQIDTLFEACQYETANMRKESPWCSIFDPHDLYLMVYSEMLLHYYEFAYGSGKSKDFGCLQIKGLVDTFSTTVNNGYDRRSAKVYVTHDLLMENVFTGLGCFKDRNLIPYNYSEMTETKYNNSHNSPFAANFAAVLYRCSDENTYKMQFYLNERPIGCCLDDSSGPCRWDAFERNIKQFLNVCIEDVCQDSSDVGKASTEPNSGLILTPRILLLVILRLLHVLGS